MKTRIIPFLILLIFIAIGCSKDTVVDNPIVEPDDGVKSLVNYDVNESRLLVWLPEDYESDTDVVIESADTTTISVSKAFYERQEQKAEEESILNITLSVEDIPFIRTVNSVSLRGDRYYFETGPAAMEDMFRNLDVQLSTQPYYSQENVTRFNDPQAAFVDNKGVVHPVKYFLDYPDGRREVVDMEEYAASRAWDMNLDWSTKLDVKYPAEFVIMELALQSRITAHAHVEINISWFRLKKFEARFGGGIDVKAPVTLGIKAPMISKQDDDRELASGPRLSGLFMIGPVPLSIGITPKVVFAYSCGAYGFAQVEFGFDYNMNYEVGMRYERNKGWSPIGSFKQDLNAHDFVARAGVKATANVGVYGRLCLDIYTKDVCTAQVGAYIEGDAGAEVSSSPNGLTVYYHCQWGVNASLDAQLKILQYTIGNFNLWQKNIHGPIPIKNYERFYPF